MSEGVMEILHCSRSVTWPRYETQVTSHIQQPSVSTGSARPIVSPVSRRIIKNSFYCEFARNVRRTTHIGCMGATPSDGNVMRDEFQRIDKK
jgi:hypothetical protein